MKTESLSRTEKFYFLFTAILFLLLASNNFGQAKRITDLTDQKNALENIVAGIKSPNDGLRESAVYLAGNYRLIDTEDALIEQLKVEKNADIKVLIGLALFRMNSEKGMNVLKSLAEQDNNTKVKRMSQAIYTEYLNTMYNRTASAQ